MTFFGVARPSWVDGREQIPDSCRAFRNLTHPPRAEKIDTVELVQAKARELQKLTLEAQRFSGEMAGKLRVAAATYSD